MKYKPGDKFIVEVEDNSGNTYSDSGSWYTLKGGFHTCDAVLDSYEPYDESAAYQRGLEDAWEAARKICELFGGGGAVFRYSAKEAIEKLRASEIHVGDEVESCRGRWVVCKTDGVLAYGLDTEWVKHIEELSKLEKTGRNFPEVAALLDKMKGDTPDV